MMMMPITGLIKAGENVTLTGTGTVGDPYVVSAAGGGAATHLVAGENVTITGTGTPDDPFVVSSHLPPRGKPVTLELADRFTYFGRKPSLIRNPDGSISLTGVLGIKGPQVGGAEMYFASLPDGYYPDDDYVLPAYLTGPDGIYISKVVVSIHGAVYVLPRVNLPADRGILSVPLDGMTYWPSA